MGSSFSFLLVRWNRIVQDAFVLLLKKDPEKKFAVLQQQRLFLFDARSYCFLVSQECRLLVIQSNNSSRKDFRLCFLCFSSSIFFFLSYSILAIGIFTALIPILSHSRHYFLLCRAISL